MYKLTTMHSSMYLLQGSFAGLAYYRLQATRSIKSTFVYEMVDPAVGANRPASPPPYQVRPPSYVAEASSSPLFEMQTAKKSSSEAMKSDGSELEMLRR